MGLNIGKLYLFQIDIEVRRLKKLGRTTEDSLTKQKDGIDLEYRRLEKEAQNDPVAMDVLSYLEDKLIEYDYEFPKLVRSSLVVQGYSLLEVYLKKICENLHFAHFRKELDSGPNAFKENSMLDNIKDYLNAKFDLDWNSFNPEWGFFCRVNKLRNCFVHHTGEFEFNKKNKNLIRYISQNPSLVVSDSDDFHSNIKDAEETSKWDNENPQIFKVCIIDETLNHEFLSAVYSFFEKLTEELY